MVLEDVLTAIDAHGIRRLGPADYLAVQQLLHRRPDLSGPALEVALASLLATNQEQWQQIRQLCTQIDASQPAWVRGPLARSDSNPAGSAPRQRAARHSHLAQLWQRLHQAPRGLWYGLLVSSLGLGLALVLPPLFTPPALTPEVPSVRPPPVVPPPAPETWGREPLLPERVIQVPSPAPLRALDKRDVAALALGALLMLLGLRCWRLPRHVERWRQDEAAVRQQEAMQERRRLAEDAERQHAPVALTYQVPRYAPLPPPAIDDAATLLGRLFRAVVGDDLDIPVTIRHSIDAGGRFSPRFADRPVARALTVLVDVERGAHPWLDGITWVLERWHTLGVRLERYDFRFDPQRLSLPDSGRPWTLRDLARHADGGPLLIISRALSTRGYDADATWLEALPAWPLRAWVDPDPRPLAERPRAARQDLRRLEQEYGLQRFPFSADGLLALARYLAANGQGVAVPAWPTLLPLTQPEVADALRQWAVLAALVPDATWVQLEAIRQHFPELQRALPTPRYVQRLIEWVAREDQERQPESADGRLLEFSAALVDRLIRQQRALDAGQPRAQRLEVRGRQLLLQQLDATRPTEPLLAQRWDLKRATHGLVLEPEQALALIEPLLGSAVQPELLQMLDSELARTATPSPYPAATRDRLELLLGRAVNRVAPVALLGRPWRAWGLPLGLTGVVGLLAGLLWCQGPATLHAWLRRPAQAVATTALAPAIDKLVKPAGLPRTITNSLGMTLVLIQPGEFRMGSEEPGAYDNEKPVHTVQLTRPFYLGQHEVTQGQWQAVMGSNPSRLQGDTNRPVENVSWDDVQEFFRRLNAREGSTTYRLPTEAEWEYAARAGSTSAYSYGDDVRQLEGYAWYNTNAGGTTHPVGKLKPNAWGLYDMHGNVWEWVQDWYGPYAAAAVVDPSGPAAGANRVVRGGSWDVSAQGVRAASRAWFDPGVRDGDLGFRSASSGPSRPGAAEGAR